MHPPCFPRLVDFAMCRNEEQEGARSSVLLTCVLGDLGFTACLRSSEVPEA